MTTPERRVETFTSPDSGITLAIRKISPLLRQELIRQNPAPLPPKNEVDYGDGKKVMEDNLADPAYAAAMVEHERMLVKEMRKLMLERGVECAVDKQAVDELRQYWRDTYGKELEGSDKLVFVQYIALVTPADVEDVIDMIMRRSQPTEAAIGATKATFPSDLQGPGRMEDKST